ncbi:ribosomal protein S4 (RPS4A) family protein [Actinidia rufa]|uniref:Ribosomal protein S4 (RPS4A) family protein n=1 Tax=Actinidia rufa TaxID=165716 RepID=A0A7J0FAP2_9ERIC|nr:ribosomal protein S4 (RPS4A) family protein [Actinidia rufa]
MLQATGCLTSLVVHLLPNHHPDHIKSRECLPLMLILRNRLKYALTYREVIAIQMQRHILVDGKVRTDKTYPTGFMDVVSIPKTNENFRLLYDTKGRFRLHSLRDEEAKFKLCKVRSDATGHEFATRMGNVFTIGKGTKPWVSLPKGKGIKLSIIEEARKRLAAQASATA